MKILKKLRQKLGERVPVTPSIVDKIKAERNRTGIGIKPLLKDRDDLPEGLKPYIVHSWLRMPETTTFKCYVDYVLKLWAELPDNVVTGEKLASEKVPITKRQLNQLHAHYNRTEIGTVSLFKNHMPSSPHGLTPNVINSWLRGTTEKAHPEHIEYVIDIWRKIPKKKKAISHRLDKP